MNDEVKRWHKDVVLEHNTTVFKSTLLEHNITSKKKEIRLLPLGAIDKDSAETYMGYFAVKGDLKYFIEPEQKDNMPLLIEETKELKYKEDIIELPIEPTPFKIIPKHTFEFKELIDGYMPFEHSNPDAFTLNKIIAFMQQVGRGYVCISSNKGFGKSFLYVNLDSITNMCNVCDEIRTGPMVLQQINETGNIVFDDLVGIKKEIRDTIERVARAFAGGKSKYRNGALKSAWTKDIYNGRLQSLTFLYNNTDHYNEKDLKKYYFDVMFSNNEAIEDRFIKLKFSGRVLEQFSKDFNMIKCAENNRQYYFNVAKEIEYLQQYKLSNQYNLKYVTNSKHSFDERKRAIYKELCWGIDMYSGSQEEYDKFIGILDSAIISYKEMLMSAGLSSTTQGLVEEERIEE